MGVHIFRKIHRQETNRQTDRRINRLNPTPPTQPPPEIVCEWCRKWRYYESLLGSFSKRIKIIFFANYAALLRHIIRRRSLISTGNCICGLLKSKWRRLRFLDMTKLENVPMVITAACTLHNVCIEVRPH